MSGYDYHIGKPVSTVSYGVGRGTQAYVTRIEERVEQVRRPSTMGYIYSSGMKAEKEGRPREVDDFITKILDEVNGPSVSTTRWSDNGVDYKFGANPRGYYEVEYVYVGSPTGPRIPRTYGEAYDQQGLSSYVYDHPPQSDYVGRDNPSDNSRLKSETPRDYEVPETRWERSSRPIYDASPYIPSHVHSHASRTYDAKPESPRDHGVPNNRLKSEMPKDYGASNNQWNDSSVKPLSPKAYEGSGNQWSRSSKPIYDQPQSNSQWGNSPLKPEISKDYGYSDNQWSKPLKPKYDETLDGRSEGIQQGNSPVKPFSSDGYGVDPDNQKGRSSNLVYDHPPRNEIGGAPNDRWGNPPLRPIYGQTLPREENIGATNPQQVNSSLKPQSPQGFGVSNNQGGRSSSPNYDPPQSKVLGGGYKNWGNSLLKPTFDQAPPYDKNNGPSYGRQSSPSINPQSPKSHEVSGNQRDRSTSPNYEHPPQNNTVAGVSNNRWGDSPLKTQSPWDRGSPNNWGIKSLGHDYDYPPPNTYKEQKKEPSNVANKDNGAPNGQQSNSPMMFGSSKGYEVPKDQKGRSTSPEYEHPQRNEIIPPPRVQIPRDHGGDSNRVSLGLESRPLNGNVDGFANKRWGNTPVNTQSPRDYGARSNQWGSPSSPVYDTYNGQKHEQPNAAVKSGVPANITYDHDPKDRLTGDLLNKDNQPKDYYGGNNQMKSSGYRTDHLNQANSPLEKPSDKTRDNPKEQKVSSGVSLQTKYPVYSGPASELVTVNPRSLDSREA